MPSITRVGEPCIAALMALAALPAHADTGVRLRASAEAVWDDNVTRSSRDERLSDAFARINASARAPVRLTEHARLVLDGGVGSELFARYSGLNRTIAEVRAELQYRPSGAYAAPTVALFIKQSGDWYASTLRDGWRGNAGLSVRKPLTDRIVVMGEAGYQWRNASSNVFDTREATLRAGLDYALARQHTLYLNLEYRDGDAITSSPPEPALAAIKVVSVRDDAFPDQVRNAYRLKARTGLLTTGWNFALTDSQSLDVSFRTVYSRPKSQPDGQSIFYVDHQLSAAYLVRF
jgi:hypothetical protein